MNLQQDKLTGGCSCGRVRYVATGKPYKVSYCHCIDCRRATGAPVVVAVMFVESRFRFSQGEPKLYESSEQVFRGFCDICGTPLSWAGIWHRQPFVFIYLSTLDNPELVQPDRHAFCDYQIDWFDTDDDFPRFTSSSPCTDR